MSERTDAILSLLPRERSQAMCITDILSALGLPNEAGLNRAVHTNLLRLRKISGLIAYEKRYSGKVGGPKHYYWRTS